MGGGGVGGGVAGSGIVGGGLEGSDVVGAHHPGGVVGEVATDVVEAITV